MAITKKQRELIWNKSSGRCWYCGYALPEKGWHVDHIDPIYRYKDKLGKPKNDVIENMVPACAPCNLFKGVFSLDEFRTEIQMQVIRARKTSVNFRTAERFEMIKVDIKSVIFWFEKQGLQYKC